MIFYFSIVLFVSAIQAVAEVGPDGTKPSLPIPAITSIKAFEGGFEVTWSPVVSPVAEEPILGYKVNVWEPDIQTVYKYDNVNGANLLVESTVPLNPNILDTAPRRPPKFSIVTRETSARFTQVKTDLFYEIRVQALTGKEIGQMSIATSIQLHSTPLLNTNTVISEQ